MNIKIKNTIVVYKKILFLPAHIVIINMSDVNTIGRYTINII